MARNKIGLMSLTCAFLLIAAFSLCFQPALRATPERRGGLWVGTSDGIARFALQDYSLELKVGDLGEIRSIALDDWNARVWVYGKGTLQAFGFSGESLLSVSVESEKRKNGHGHDSPRDEDHERCNLIVDPADGGVWLAEGASLYRFSIQGDLEMHRDFRRSIRGLALDSVQSRLWVATQRTLTAYDRSGNEVASIDPGRRPRIEEIALDPSTGDLWVASGHFLGRIDSGGNTLFWRFFEGFSRMVHDGHGGLWAAQENTLLRLNSSGKVLFKVRPFGKWGGGDIADFALDPKDHSLWVIDRRSAAHVSPDGDVLGSANLGRAVRDRLFAVALYRDVRPPTLRITSPAEGSFLSSARPEIELTFSDDRRDRSRHCRQRRKFHPHHWSHFR